MNETQHPAADNVPTPTATAYEYRQHCHVTGGAFTATDAAQPHGTKAIIETEADRGFSHDVASASDASMHRTALIATCAHHGERR